MDGMRYRATMLALALFLALAAPAVRAAPCAGFDDVDSTDAFCPNVEWLKNRAITLGCNGTSYCPFAAVSRLSMAAFMNRLGTAMTPVQLPASAAPGALDVDSSPVVCQTDDLDVEDFPRRAYVDVSFGAQAPADLALAADLVASIDGGANWTPLNAFANRGFVPATRWTTLADLASRDLAVGESVRFGVRVSRGGMPGTADVADSRCQLRVLVHSRNGATSPF